MPVCPRCGFPYTEHPSLSRRDNKTLICPQCGDHEAMVDYLGKEEWWVGNFRDGASVFIGTFEEAKEAARDILRKTGLVGLISRYIPGQDPGEIIWSTWDDERPVKSENIKEHVFTRWDRWNPPAEEPVKSNARRSKYDDPWGFQKAINWDAVDKALADPVERRELLEILGIDPDTGKKKRSKSVKTKRGRR
ncbi:MAG: hypothetical protein E7Z63_01090 [Thermoplasmata archaeon]|nr:hypothetical protein [Thermoplasmata archaeon]